MRPSTFLLFAVALTLTPWTSATGQSDRPNARMAEVVVFGDVTKSSVVTFPLDTPTNAAELVKGTGGFKSGAVNVRVIRGGQQVVLATRLEPGQKSDFRIANGDIVYVHSAKAPTSPAEGSPVPILVIHPERLPMFSTVYAKRTPISALLADGRLNWQNHGFRLIRTHPLASRDEPTAETTFMPGDVLFVDRMPRVEAASATKPEQAPSVAPALPTLTSPQTTQAAPAEPAVFVPDSQPGTGVVQTAQEGPPEPVTANYGGIDTAPVTAAAPPKLPPAIPPAAPLAAQPIATPTTAPQMPSSVPLLDRDPWETGPALNATTATMQNQAVTATASELEARINSSIPAFNASSTTAPAPPVSDMANYGTVAAASEPETNAETAPASSSTIPLPSELAAKTENSDSGATMWYVAGLIGALFIVLGAWVYGSRALAEAPQLRSAAAPQKRPIKKRVQTVTQAPLQGSPDAPTATKPPTPVLKPIVPQASAPTATQPVPQPIPQSVVPLSELSAAPPANPIAQPGMASSQPVPAPLPQPITPGPTPIPAASAPAMSPAKYVPAVAMDAVPNSAPQAAPMAAAVQSPTTAIPTTPEPIPVPDTQTTRVLDALVNNSIPVTETPVQLPTHLEFFGDSQGPQQLRIDPGHATLRGPHMGLKAGLESKQTTQQSQGELA